MFQVVANFKNWFMSQEIEKSECVLRLLEKLYPKVVRFTCNMFIIKLLNIFSISYFTSKTLANAAIAFSSPVASAPSLVVAFTEIRLMSIFNVLDKDSFISSM